MNLREKSKYWLNHFKHWKCGTLKYLKVGDEYRLTTLLSEHQDLVQKDEKPTSGGFLVYVEGANDTVDLAIPPGQTFRLYATDTDSISPHPEDEGNIKHLLGLDPNRPAPRDPDLDLSLIEAPEYGLFEICTNRKANVKPHPDAFEACRIYNLGADRIRRWWIRIVDLEIWIKESGDVCEIEFDHEGYGSLRRLVD